MKNRYIFAVLMCGLAIISGCQKDELENIPEGAVMLTAEGFHGDGSKTSVSGNTVQWVDNDQVKFNNADPVSVTVTGSGKAYVSSAPSTNPLYAYYPADLAVGTYQSDNTNITLPAEYTSSYDGSGNQVLQLPMVAKVTGASPSTIEFKHLTAAVKVTVKNMAGVDVTLDSVVITSNSLQFSGTRSVTIGEGSVSVAAQAAGTPALADRRVRVSFSESPIISSGATKEVQVPFWPVAATTGTGDFTINVYTHDGSDKYFLHKNGTSPELARNELLTANVSIGNNVTDLSTVSADITVENGKILTGTLAGNYKISIADGATVTLNGVSINDNGGWTSGDYAGISCEGDATIILSGENILRGIGVDYPGIHIKENKTLTIRGTGSLDASGNPTGDCYSAGIGGNYYKKCGNIVIEGGTITATGGNKGGAAIGGAFCGGYGYITISGGTVTATAVEHGAGIGSGCNSKHTSGNITISGGTVTATSQGNGAGIGSGSSSASSVGDILISGGTIMATGGNNAAGIGSSNSSSCGGITIANTVTRVTATKGSGAPNSIGAGNGGTCGTVTVGGVVGAISTSPYTYEPLPEGSLSGKFTINGSGDKVRFSQGNLQATYDGSSWSWAFAANQWDYIGNAEGNTKVSGSTPFVSGYSGTSTTVDLFGWVGASSTWDGVNQYGITSSVATNNTNGYGNVATEALKSDWGATIGTGWRTLSSAEWTYVFNTRSSGSTVNGTSNARYTHATINTDGTGVNGMILFPDGVTIANGEATSWGTINGNSSWGTQCTTAQWSALAAKGCVFLPAAGYRSGTVYSVGSYGYYWSSSPNTSYAYLAYGVYFNSGNLSSASSYERYLGFSVRLVKDAN